MSNRQIVPKYSHHVASGQARVILSGKHHYLGKFGSKESQKKYADLIARHCQTSTSIPECKPGQFPLITIDELLVQYLEFAESYYSSNGKTTKEYTCMLEAVRHLRPRYGDSLAMEFGPRKLAKVRDDMISGKLARTVINNRVNRIRRLMKWAVSMELIPPSVFEGIRALEGLKYGRSAAKETDPVKPVQDNEIDLVAGLASPQVAAMIQLQRLTGMRPGEVVIMRRCDINRDSVPWVYEPSTHKNKYRGHKREIPLGPKAQKILRPFLRREPDAFLFSPEESEVWRNTERRKRRQSPMTPSQAKRKPKVRPKRKKRERYDVDSYRRAIYYVILKHNREQASLPEADRKPVKQWHPHQLRHQFATVVRKKFGAEAVQIGLGHKSTDLVDLYAEKNLAAAKSIADVLG